MSFRVVAKVLRYSDERLARRLILIAVAEAAGDDGVSWVDQVTIAGRARLSRTHVAECISEMAAEGVLEVRKAKRGRRRINVYRVLLGGLDDVDYDRLPFELDAPFTVSEVPTPSAPATVSEVPTPSAGDHVGSSELTVSDPPGFSAGPSLYSFEPSEEPSVTHGELALAGVPAIVKIDGRDVAFDALAEACQVDVAGNRGREVGIALAGRKTGPAAQRLIGIRELVWLAMGRGDLPAAAAGEEFERALAAAIVGRARSYQQVMPGASLTPLALAKWWTDVERRTRPTAAGRALELAGSLRERGL